MMLCVRYFHYVLASYFGRNIRPLLVHRRVWDPFNIVEVSFMTPFRVFMRFWVILLGLLGITLINTAMLFGQVTGTGVIQGTVLDPTGAVIPGATVTATNPATGLATTRTTTDAGFYVLSPLVPGEYKVTVTAKGFEELLQEHVVVNAMAVVGLNLTLTVGSATQEITVSAAPPALETVQRPVGNYHSSRRLYEPSPRHEWRAEEPRRVHLLAAGRSVWQRVRRQCQRR